jgi:alkanesulfonate monooxygenase SsuD/methylene tetrahydromethanopterin reductase-like flavin-dependent oxidoreductase (luciferase family)
VADEVQALYLDGKREDAYNAIPDELADATALIGDEAEVADRLARYTAAGVDRLIVSPISPEREQRLHTLERLAELAGIATQASAAR